MKFLARLREPSTWAGLAALVAIWRPEVAQVVPALGDSLGSLAASVLGVVAAVKRDPGAPD